MGIQKLLKPQSNAGNLMESGSEIKWQSSGATLRLKIDTLTIQATCDLIDATRDEDNFVKHLSTNRVSGAVRISGHVIRGALVGFNNLPDDLVTIHAVLGHSGTGSDYHVIRFNIAITNISLGYSRQNVTVPVVIEGKVTQSVSSKSIYEAATTISAQS
tara:strand:+ start:1057 stop:1533 length:477 start_codon:yes stop_codon:yes gene_type:complete